LILKIWLDLYSFKYKKLYANFIIFNQIWSVDCKCFKAWNILKCFLMFQSVSSIQYIVHNMNKMCFEKYHSLIGFSVNIDFPSEIWIQLINKNVVIHGKASPWFIGGPLYNVLFRLHNTSCSCRSMNLS
jgi:hypothetical protein